MASADQLIAGPLVRRVGLDQVSIWAVLSTHANVTVTIRRHPEADSEILKTHTVPTLDVGKKLSFALVTVKLEPGNRLEPDTRYAYDFEIDGVGLGDLGLLRDGEISIEREGSTTPSKHPHLALGYLEGLLPTFLTPPSDPARLTLAHGSCRRPYASGSDGLVALDQVIEGTREPADDVRRPHLLILTGDQIYADDVSPELLEWMTDQANERIGRDVNGKPIEGVRVELRGLDDPPFMRPPAVRFPVDKHHFPIGRRQRVMTRAGGMSSGDSASHLIGFGEYVMHYVMSWCNLTWPALAGADWQKIFNERKKRVEAYLGDWRETFLSAATRSKDLRQADSSFRTPGAIAEQVPYVDAWQLVPDHARVLDAYGIGDGLDEWDITSDDGAWVKHWPPSQAPTPARPEAMSPVLPSGPDLVGSLEDLDALWKLHTPAWYAGREHYSISLDYRIQQGDTITTSLPTLNNIDIRSDKVVSRLRQLRRFYDGLPYARRALANVSTLMIFDDHEVTDDWNVSQRWIDGVRTKTLGIDLVTNGMLAYALCQDWGNVPDRYADDSPNAKLLPLAGRMFQEPAVAAGQAPSIADREELELRFGFRDVDNIEEQATWTYSIGDANAPYEIIVIDSRTKRGYDTLDSPPANLSYRAIDEQIAEQPPGQSAFTILVASMPVLGFPPLEQIGQPFLNLIHDYQRNPRRTATWRFGRFSSIKKDYEFGPLIKDPEPWGFAPIALERLFARLSTRQNVIILSGDVHYSISAKHTYWKRQATGLVPTTRIVQLTSSALQNQTGADEVLLAHMALAQQFGSITSGTFDRLGWSETIDAPQVPDPSWQLRAMLQKNPVLIPTRMLPEAFLEQLRTRTLGKPPEWAWRMSLLKDLRHDDVRYGAIVRPRLMPEAELLAQPDLAFRTIANVHDWHARLAVPRRFMMSSNLGVVRFQRAEVPAEAPGPSVPAPPADHLEVIHSLYSWGLEGEPTGTASWPTVRRAAPYTEHRVPLTPLDELPPDRELPT